MFFWPYCFVRKHRSVGTPRTVNRLDDLSTQLEKQPLHCSSVNPGGLNVKWVKKDLETALARGLRWHSLTGAPPTIVMIGRDDEQTEHTHAEREPVQWKPELHHEYAWMSESKQLTSKISTIVMISTILLLNIYVLCHKLRNYVIAQNWQMKFEISHLQDTSMQTKGSGGIWIPSIGWGGRVAVEEDVYFYLRITVDELLAVFAILRGCSSFGISIDRKSVTVVCQCRYRGNCQVCWLKILTIPLAFVLGLRDCS